MRRIFVLSLAFLALVNLRPLYALDAIEFLSGYLTADDLREQGDYEVIPLFVSFDFDGEPLFEKFNIDPPGKLQLIVEPFINTVIAPTANVEGGANFLIKYIFPLTDHIQPYFKGGLGMLYMSQHTREQSTQYNFLPQAGAGLHIFLTEKTALTFEYRYRHLSNASFSSPNKGIDATMSLGGISFFF